MNDKVTYNAKGKNNSSLNTFLLGKNQPDIFTLLTFRMAFYCSILMVFWNLFSWFAFSYGWTLEESKGIPIGQLIEARAQHFGFTLNNYQSKLTQHFLISTFSWLISLIYVFLLYRKNPFFILVMFVGHSIYLLSAFLLLGYNFFLEDIGWLEKLALLVSHVSGWISWILQRNERRGISIFKTD